jgi:hypothetical protein
MLIGNVIKVIFFVSDEGLKTFISLYSTATSTQHCLLVSLTFIPNFSLFFPRIFQSFRIRAVRSLLQYNTFLLWN